MTGEVQNAKGQISNRIMDYAGSMGTLTQLEYPLFEAGRGYPKISVLEYQFCCSVQNRLEKED